jgi:hypothetical protein
MISRRAAARDHNETRDAQTSSDASLGRNNELNARLGWVDVKMRCSMALVDDGDVRCEGCVLILGIMIVEGWECGFTNLDFRPRNPSVDPYKPPSCTVWTICLHLRSRASGLFISNSWASATVLRVPRHVLMRQPAPSVSCQAGEVGKRVASSIQYPTHLLCPLMLVSTHS